MKKIFSILFGLLIVSCQETGELTQQTPDGVISEQAQLKRSGLFQPTSGITVSGTAEIYLDHNQYKVKLDEFSISNGPDLKVYLSKSATPDQFINLGNLTSQSVYPIPLGVSINEYTHVLIHCQQYNHLFAVAQLEHN